MKNTYPSIVGLLAILMLIVSLLPMAKPEVAEANPGTLYWETVATPAYYPAAGWILKSPSNVDRIAIGSDGATFYAVDIAASNYTDDDDVLGAQVLYKSTNAGITWSDKISKGLYAAMDDADELVWGDEMWVWDVVVAPDDPNFVAVVTNSADNWTPTNVWLSNNGGTSWMNTSVPDEAIVIPVSQYAWIGAIAISPSYSGGLGTTHDIAIGTRNPSEFNAVGEVWVMSYPQGIGAWKSQEFEIQPNYLGNADILALKFSPTYVGDFCLAAVAATRANMDPAYRHNTWLCVGFRNIISNTTEWNTNIGPHFTGYPVEVATEPDASPHKSEIVSADLELVSDWNGDDPRSRKYFVSYDAPDNSDSDVYRIDDTIVYDLNVPIPVWGGFNGKRIASIAYYGTSASGKLLAGERLGNQCSATVQSWISLDPLVCPGVCWTPSSKPQTGGAGTDCDEWAAFGNMMVAWAPDGTRAYSGTSSANMSWPDSVISFDNYTESWEDFPKDESSFCITRNDNLTWNQLSLIDTWVAKWTDVAPAADCSVMFAASINANDADDQQGPLPDDDCAGFDSVWRTPNFDKPGTALGSTWERVLTKATTPEACGVDQSNYAILRLAPDKTNGSVVFWAAGGNDDYQTTIAFDDTTWTMDTPNTTAVMWSEDSGDLWYPIRPNLEVQDMAAESSAVLYILDINGKVQKLTYARPNWKVAGPVDTCIGSGKSIAALATGHVLVGPQEDNGYVAYSADSGTTWGATGVPISTAGKVHVAFDSKFLDNKIIYVGDEANNSDNGSVWRWVWGTSTQWTDLVPPHAHQGLGFGGLVLSTEGTLYTTWADSRTEGGTELTGEKIEAVVTTAISATANTNLLVSYEDQNGSSASVQFTVTASAPVGTVYDITLPSATTVSNITNITENPSTATTGVIQIRGVTSGEIFATYDLSTGAYTDGYEHTAVAGELVFTSAVDRTLHPTRGTPKPGIDWCTLDYSLVDGTAFNLEPGSLKSCGCLTPDTSTTIYAVDDHPYASWEYIDNVNNPHEGYTEATGTGAIWLYTDCLAKKGPVTSGPDLVGCDPVSGRNQEINLTWEQPCLATKYDILIAKDSSFTTTIWSKFNYKPGGVLSPNIIVPPGDNNFECGHTYYWMVRVSGSAFESDILSPWSEVQSFQIKAGLPVTTPYIGPIILNPLNGASGVPIKGTTFSWTTFKETYEYYFQLSETPDMLKILADVKVPTTAYTFDGTLKNSTNYYWQVRANKPVVSDWSPVFSFLTEKAPATPLPQQPQPPPPPTPIWVWILIAFNALQMVVNLILIIGMRRV